ncbi:very short patch repair endonuclease [Massilia soli]|uniref:Very short patch repair endonuclease n=1 Tax=Massilia soli TaxID=2792854 RepID=A0ABS7SJS1_9BURK|nr:very short patch repair endonuclease [Massilia soli]
MDVFDADFRSKLMSRIRGSGNLSTELRVIEIFRRLGIAGWRRKSNLIGRPDFVFHRERVVVFVDGCFWHGCPTCGKVSKSNIEYWTPKIIANKSRDLRVSRQLRKDGWAVIRVWECRLRNPIAFVSRLRRKLNR